jgi:hypothetical protein
VAETIEGLRERRAWLLRQVELTDRSIEKLMQKQNAPRTPKPEARELPGVPPPPPPSPPKPNIHLENHAEFQTARRERLQKLGVEYVPDEPNTAAFVVVTMKKLRDQCTDDDELWRLIDAYLRLDWPANPPRDWPAGKAYSPYPLRILGGPNVFQKLLAEIRAPRAA